MTCRIDVDGPIRRHRDDAIRKLDALERDLCWTAEERRAAVKNFAAAFDEVVKRAWTVAEMRAAVAEVTEVRK